MVIWRKVGEQSVTLAIAGGQAGEQGNASENASILNTKTIVIGLLVLAGLYFAFRRK